MPGENRRKTGKDMEDLAAAYLAERGVRILERNFRSREAEIDLVGAEGQTLVFIEVKARRSGSRSGCAAEAVGPAKQRKICRCADYYMYIKGIDPCMRSVRFDVLAITAGEKCGIEWIRDAFPYMTCGSGTKPHWRVW